MNVLVLGSGGREHALCWRLSQDKSCSKVFAWPGNPGMEGITTIQTVFNQQNLKDFIKLHDIKLVIPGAEKYLYEGVSDWCEEWKVACFGPTAKASRLEKSKLFAKQIMMESGIPTAIYRDLTPAFSQDLNSAKEILETFQRPVIKISGPSLGKGVFVCKNPVQAFEVLKEIKQTELAGLEEGLMVEEGLSGKEISLFYACNGDQFVFLGAAQDHKRLLDNDEGPNTGGMGTLSPVAWATDAFITKSTETFVKPTLKKMVELGCPFKGVLFLGLMVNENESNLLEYNVRFGDPETQVLMPLIEGNLTQVFYEISSGQNISQKLTLKDKVAVHVVKSAHGYPGTFGTAIEKDKKIVIDHKPDQNVHCFFAGVRREGQDLFTSGGRVLGVTALADNKVKARELVYRSLSICTFEGEHFRHDIGEKV